MMPRPASVLTKYLNSSSLDIPLDDVVNGARVNPKLPRYIALSTLGNQSILLRVNYCHQNLKTYPKEKVNYSLLLLLSQASFNALDHFRLLKPLYLWFCFGKVAD